MKVPSRGLASTATNNSSKEKSLRRVIQTIAYLTFQGAVGDSGYDGILGRNGHRGRRGSPGAKGFRGDDGDEVRLDFYGHPL